MRYRPNEPITFTDQQTHFTIKDGVQISKIIVKYRWSKIRAGRTRLRLPWQSIRGKMA